MERELVARLLALSDSSIEDVYRIHGMMTIVLKIELHHPNSMLEHVEHVPHNTAGP